MTAHPTHFRLLQADFDTAVRELDERAAALSRTAQPGRKVEWRRVKTVADRVVERERRLENNRRAIREDIERAHGRFSTSCAGVDLAVVAGELLRLHGFWEGGQGSHELLPRVRSAILDMIHREAGVLAVENVFGALERHGVRWPDPSHHDPSATPEQIEAATRRRAAEARRELLRGRLDRTAERALGIVSGWGSDYPERGTALWEETVLEGVCAGVRGQLVVEFDDLVWNDLDPILHRTERWVGSELDKLHRLLTDGVTTTAQARQAVVTSLDAIDRAVREVAWEHIQEKRRGS
jgi:hypothetical protein